MKERYKDPNWISKAECRGLVSLFFPTELSNKPKGRPRKNAKPIDILSDEELRAIAVCRGCSVRTPCYDSMIAERNIAGIVMAGLTVTQRKTLFKSK